MVIAGPSSSTGSEVSKSVGVTRLTSGQCSDHALGLEGTARAIRQLTVKTFHECGGGHYGGSLSVCEILATLYYDVMRINPDWPSWPDRDRLVLSKGHAGGALYATLAMRGYFPISELDTLNRRNSRFGVHPDMRKIPGIDMSTGSLGHGLPVAVGMALAGRLSGRDYRVFAIVGDGECHEGSVWEAFMAAAHHKLDNLVVIVDRNRLSMDGPTEEVMALEPLEKKLQAFNWMVESVDGHDTAQLLDVLKRVPLSRHSPTALIARTIKGKGISFMENATKWHYGGMSDEQLTEANRQLGIEVS